MNFKKLFSVFWKLGMVWQLCWPAICWSEPLANLQIIEQQAEQFLRRLPGVNNATQIHVNPIDSSLQLPACDHLVFFLSNPHFNRGSLRLNANCNQPQTWSIFIAATVLDPISYWVSNKALVKNQVLSRHDIAEQKTYHSALGSNLVTGFQQIQGRPLAHDLPAGSSLHLRDFLIDPKLSRGQTVTLLSSKSGFKISNQGKLLSDAIAGERTKVKTSSKQIISGIARSGGIVEIN